MTSGTKTAVLVVDDDQAVREFLSAMLSESGDTNVVATVADGPTAMRVLEDRASEVDVCLVDYWMPHMTGFDLLSVIRNNYPAIGVVILSGVLGQSDAIERGADAFVSKADGFGTILDTVRGVAEQKQNSRALNPVPLENDRSVEPPRAEDDRRLRSALQREAVPVLEALVSSMEGCIENENPNRLERRHAVEWRAVAASAKLRSLLSSVPVASRGTPVHDLLMSLHDDVLPHLYAIRLRSQYANDDFDSAAFFESARRDARQALTALNGCCGARIAEDTDDDKSTTLIAALLAICGDFGQMGLDVEVLDDAPGVELSGRAVKVVTDAVREALTNVLKHAGYASALVRLALDSGGIRITVKDRGRGFRPDEVSYGFGIKNSIEGRLGEIGGRAQVHSAPGRGAKVVMWAPIE